MKIIRFVSKHFYAIGAVDASWLGSKYNNVNYRQVRLDHSYRVNPFTKETKLFETVILHSMVSVAKSGYTETEFKDFMDSALRWYTNH